MSRGRRGPTGDRGAAIVEMALVGVLLVLLLFGILSFGYLMGFRQNMVQAAAEGARRGAVAIPSTSAQSEAQAGALDAVQAFGQNCTGGMSCVATVAACVNKPTANCVSVRLTYDYDHYPLLPKIPILGALLPKTIVTNATAEVNP